LKAVDLGVVPCYAYPMRKFVAAIFTICVFLPLSFGALGLKAAGSFAFDRKLFESTFGQEALYLGWSTPAASILADTVDESEGFSVDTESADAAFSATFSPSDLAGIVVGLVDETFDQILAVPGPETLAFHFASLKADLRDQRIPNFMRIYEASSSSSSKNRSAGQLPANVEALSRFLRSSVENLPDTLVLPPEEASLPGVRGRPEASALVVSKGLPRAVSSFSWGLSVAALLVVFAAAMTYSSSWRDRLRWMSGALAVPSACFIVAGLAFSLGSGAALLSGPLSHFLRPVVDEVVNAGGTDAKRIAELLSPLFSRIGHALFLWGLIPGGISAALGGGRFMLSEDEEEP